MGFQYCSMFEQETSFVNDVTPFHNDQAPVQDYNTLSRLIEGSGRSGKKTSVKVLGTLSAFTLWILSYTKTKMILWGKKAT